MAEETDGQDSGADASGAGVDPAAVALALNAANSDPSIAEDARAFLRKQSALVDDQRSYIAIQKHHLTEQFKKLRLDIWQQRLGVLLRIATGFVGLAIAAGLAFMIWDASQSSGLLIEPFSVPPDLAARGMTGQVVAAELLDRLASLQLQTGSIRAPKSYANSWTQQDIKLDIPETGVSLAELEGFLREKLGHDIHITGEIVHTASGVSLTVRAGVLGAESITGSEAELNTLVQQLGESVYRLTQPYRFAFYLASHDRIAEADPLLKVIAETGANEDRPWGYLLWGDLSGEEDGIDTQLRLAERAVAMEPDNYVAQNLIGYSEFDKSMSEEALRDGTKSISLLSGNGRDSVREDAIPYLQKIMRALINQETGAFHEAAQDIADAIQSGLRTLPALSAYLASAETGEHDVVAARATMVDPTDNAPEHGFNALANIWAKMQIDGEVHDWAGILSQADAIAPLLPKYPGLRSYLPSMTAPFIAYAEASLGNFGAAEARIAATPANCYVCLRTRARIAELQDEGRRADYWFARAVHDAPSVPFAYADWGQALLERGDSDGAIDKFTIANQKGPKFADPLEGWGEALMKKNRSDLAVAKFTAAEKYAPNWGRLHLKWGEALGYAGHKDDAQKQYQTASTLDLSVADKAVLARQMQSKV